MTSSPGPIPIASSTSTIASVPLATPTVCGTPRYRAASSSKALTLGPRMNSPASRTLCMRSRSSGIRGAYCARTSTSGIAAMARQSSRAQFAHDHCGEEREDRGDDDVVHVTEVAVEMRIARAERPADGGECEGPDGGADRGQHDVPAERHPKDPGRDRDERPHHRSHPTDQDDQIVPALEPPLGTVEFALPEMEHPAAALDERP